MRIRHHMEGGVRSEALVSDCGRYRYRLTRRWGDGPAMAFVMLNPSVADAAREDPTSARCLARARAAGAGGLILVNLCAFRATRPRELFAAADPEGPENAAILSALPPEATVLCAWGDHGLRDGRGPRAEALLRRGGHAVLWHLGLTRRGAPRHPLYVAARVPHLPLGTR